MEAEILAKEHALVERAKTDEQAFAELYNRYFNEVYGFLMKRLGRREVVEDLVSELFLKVFTHLESYQPQQCSFRAWLYRVATNLLIDYTRKASVRHEKTVEEFPDVMDHGADEHEKYARSEDAEKVRQVLKTLPERYQKILHLKFFAELSNTEIAETLEESANTVGVVLHRALKKFEEAYQTL
jgi:RNA polymerase sigma-70 factor (ECF subfamily)